MGSLAIQIPNVLHEVLVRPTGIRVLHVTGRIRNTLLMGCYMETSAEYLETSAQYREFAEECIRLAKQVEIDDHRKTLEEWLRLGEWWLRRRIKSISSQPIVFRQPRLRALLPNETTLVPCAAAKPALAHLRRCALAKGTLERSVDTVPQLPRINASPIYPQRKSAISVPSSGEELVAEPGGALKRMNPNC